MEQVMHATSLDIAGSALFHFRYNALQGGTREERRALSRVAAIFNRRTLSLVKYWNLPLADTLIPEERKVQHDLQSLRELLEKVVSNCSPGDGSLVDHLVRQGREGEGLRDDVRHSCTVARHLC